MVVDGGKDVVFDQHLLWSILTGAFSGGKAMMCYIIRYL